MEVLLFLLPFLLLGIAVLFIAFSGSPGAAREAYLTRGNRAFRVLVPLLYIALGVAVPALIIASRDEARGGTEELKSEELSSNAEEGKQLFRNACASCHNLDAVNARGVTGPDLDEIGEVTRDRIVNAIKNGGTGQGRMPANLYQGEDARKVAEYLSLVAGK
jgi:mono/diheme cytochrome c family protein